MRMLLALRDVRVGTFLAPLTAATPGEAERTYMEILTSPGTLVQKHPRDFDLYHIGFYDEVTGNVTALLTDKGVVEAPRVLLSAAQLGIGEKGGEV